MKPTLNNPVLVAGFTIKSQNVTVTIVGLTTDYTNSDNAIAHATL